MSTRPGLPILRLVAEFGVIVLGVLVALFAESAWQERQERAEEAEVLERIHREVVEDSSRISTAGLWLDFVVPAAKRVPGILQGRDSVSNSGALALVYAAATLNTPGALIWTWDELRETGRTDLIEDDDLRRGLTLYFGTSEEFETARAELPEDYRAAVLGLLPPDYTRRVLNECLREDGGGGLAAAPRENTIAALESCTETPREAAAPTLLRTLRETEGLAREAARLAYELELLGERLGPLVAARDTLLAEMAARGIGEGN